MAGIFTAIRKVTFTGEDMITGIISTDHILEEYIMIADNTTTGDMVTKDITIIRKTAAGKPKSPLTIASQRAF